MTLKPSDKNQYSSSTSKYNEHCTATVQQREGAPHAASWHAPPTTHVILHLLAYLSCLARSGVTETCNKLRCAYLRTLAAIRRAAAPRLTGEALPRVGHTQCTMNKNFNFGCCATNSRCNLRDAELPPQHHPAAAQLPGKLCSLTCTAPPIWHPGKPMCVPATCSRHASTAYRIHCPDLAQTALASAQWYRSCGCRMSLLRCTKNLVGRAHPR